MDAFQPGVALQKSQRRLSLQNHKLQVAAEARSRMSSHLDAAGGDQQERSPASVTPSSKSSTKSPGKSPTKTPSSRRVSSVMGHMDWPLPQEPAGDGAQTPTRINSLTELIAKPVPPPPPRKNLRDHILEEIPERERQRRRGGNLLNHVAAKYGASLLDLHKSDELAQQRQEEERMVRHRTKQAQRLQRFLAELPFSKIDELATQVLRKPLYQRPRWLIRLAYERWRKLEYVSKLPFGVGLKFIALSQLMRHTSSDIIIRKGETPVAVYLVAEGAVEVLQPEPVAPGPNSSTKHILRPIAVLEAGSLFGEIGVLQHKPRSATVRVVEDATLMVIEKTDYIKLLRSFDEPNLHARADFFRSLYPFEKTKKHVLEALAFLVHQLELKPNQTACHAGEPALKAYFIAQGELVAVGHPTPQVPPLPMVPTRQELLRWNLQCVGLAENLGEETAGSFPHDVKAGPQGAKLYRIEVAELLNAVDDVCLKRLKRWASNNEAWRRSREQTFERSRVQEPSVARIRPTQSSDTLATPPPVELSDVKQEGDGDVSDDDHPDEAAGGAEADLGSDPYSLPKQVGSFLTAQSVDKVVSEHKAASLLASVTSRQLLTTVSASQIQLDRPPPNIVRHLRGSADAGVGDMLVSSPGADRHDSDGEEPEQVYLRRSPPLGKGVTAPHVVNATHALLLRKEAARPTFIPHRRENCTIRPTLRGNVSRMLAPASAADVVLEREKRGGSALNALTLGPLVRLDTDTPTFQKCLQLLDVRATWTGGSNQAHRLEESDEELSRTAETDAYGRWIPSRPTTSLDLPAHWKHDYAGHGSPTHLSPSLRSTGKKKRQSKLGQGSVSRKPCSQGRLRALDNDGHAPNDPPMAASGLHVTESYSYVAERLQDEQRAHEDLHAERLHEEKDSAMQMDSAIQRHASDSLDAWEDLRQEPADEAQATQQLLQENWSRNPVGLRPLVAQSDPVMT